MPIRLDIIQQPLFYLFVAVTILISLGYSWGRRWNKRIYLGAFDAITRVIQPKDQQFTNIGGLTGYHANFIPHKNKYIRRVDATITLLPRQSWLYFPVSRLIRKFDRLYIVYQLAPLAEGVLREGHLIEERYSSFAGAKIENAHTLASEPLSWGGLNFTCYYEDEEIKKKLELLKSRIGDPGPLRHVALVPEHDRLVIFLIPRPGQVFHVVETVTRWFTELAGAAVAAKRGQAQHN